MNSLPGLKLINRTQCGLECCTIEECKTHWKELFPCRDMELGTGSYSVIFCNKCGLGFTEPCPTEDTAHLLYTTRKTSDFDNKDNPLIGKLKDHLAKRQVSSLIRKTGIKYIRKVLDHGTGNGRYAVAVKEYLPDAEVSASDHSSAPPEAITGYNNAHPGKKIRYNCLSKAEPAEKYDLIILRHVLEHVHHPVSLLRSLAGKLSDKGVIYIEVPDLNSALTRLFKGNSKLVNAPRHIFHFTRTSLSKAADNAGLEAKISGSHIPMTGWLIFNLLHGKSYGLPYQIAGMMLHPLQLLAERLSGSSSVINAVCKKKTLSDDIITKLKQ